MKQKTRDEINFEIQALRAIEKLIDKHTQEESDLDENEWHDKYYRLCAMYDNQREFIDNKTQQIFYRNFDKKIQKSVNFYRSKVNLPMMQITAHF